jgi:cation diffusion facilitator CzcD-associated flavoprotein CzcO
MMTVANPISRVAVIGAGPSGLAALKYVEFRTPSDAARFSTLDVLTILRFLLAEKYFERIDVFEQRSSVGGAWNYSPSSAKVGVATTVPHLDPHEPAEKPTWIKEADGSTKAVFVSPLYDRLETNIPKELMRYSDQPFPPDAQLFPKHRTVNQYLEEYAEATRSHIHFETQVVDVKLSDPKLGTWDVTTTDLHNSQEITQTYDAVVVASGHFTVPFLPDIPGIENWDQSYPKTISHSKFYDSPEPFAGKKVVVVGNSASGLDIGAQINEVSAGPIIMSQRSESYLAACAPSDKIICPEIVEFLSPTKHSRALRFADGQIEENIDAVVFCTGYFYSYPFLSSLNPAVVTHGWRTKHVYQQLFYSEHPTLVFPVLAQRVIPFPMAENQAAVFSRVWSQRLKLPSKKEMQAWEDSQVSNKGDGKSFHLLPFPMDADYLNFLYTWAASAKPRPGLSNGGHGKLGTFWGERERWMRALFPEIRRAFVQKEEQRCKITTLEDLGFIFDDQKVKSSI